MLEVWHVMVDKSYRIKFRVPPDVAEVLDAQDDRAGYVARAVTWYARFGAPCLQKLDALLDLAARGQAKLGESGPGGESSGPAVRDDIDDAFADFVL
ncbi:hypothetical protein [Desulfofundulus thermosubterraneus]|nr:hypothetical protein [Desulfofundulus thermosubterraneus]